MQRRLLIARTLAATAAGLAGLAVPGLAQAGLRTRSASALAVGKRVVLGSVALACLTDRRRLQTVGGGFREGAASSNAVKTSMAGLSAADFQAAADAAYASAVETLQAQGFEVLDNGALVAMLQAEQLVQASGTEYAFPEGNRQSSTATVVGASAFGGYVPMPNWTPTAPGLAGLKSMGLMTAANTIDALFRKQAAATGVPILSLLIGVSPVRIEAGFGTEWRVPDAFGRGGITRTGTLSTETGLSSHPLLTRLAAYPASGDSPGEVAMDEEIGIQGGVGALVDTTSGTVKGVQAVGNFLSALSGSGRSSNTTEYTLQADAQAYVDGTQALSRDVVKALLAGLS